MGATESSTYITRQDQTFYYSLMNENQQLQYLLEDEMETKRKLQDEIKEQKEENIKLQNLFQAERNSKAIAMKKCSDLQQQVIDSKKVISNLHYALGRQKAKLRTKESNFNTSKNSTNKGESKLTEDRKQLETKCVRHKQKINTYIKQNDDLTSKINKQKCEQGTLPRDKLKLQKTKIKNLKSKLKKQLSNRNEEINNLQTMLNRERDSKTALTKRCDDLLTKVKDSEKVIFNLESSLSFQEDKLKCKESELNTFKNRISKEGNELIEVRKNLETERVIHKEEQITYKKQLDNQIRQLHKQKHDQETLHKDKLQLQKTIKDLEFKLNEQLCNHNGKNNKLQTMLNIERDSKTALTKRYENLLTKVEDSEKVIFNLETALKLQEDKLKAQEVEFNTFNNKINTKGELKGNEILKKELQMLDTCHQADLCQVQTLKDNLLKAEEKIMDLENVLDAYQMEREIKKNEYSLVEKQNNESNLVLLKEVETTKILEAFSGLVDLKKRIGTAKQKLERQIENDWRKIYEDQVKKLKDENEALCQSLENICLNNKKVENLDENYFKLQLKNDHEINSLSKTIENTANRIYKLHREFTVNSPAKVLLAINQNLRQIKKFEDSNYKDLHQKEQDLLKQIITQLQKENEILQDIKKFQSKSQQSPE